MRSKPFSLQSLLNKFIHLLPWLLMVGLFYFNATFLYQSRQLGDFGSFIASGTAARAGLNPYGSSRAPHIPWMQILKQYFQT